MTIQEKLIAAGKSANTQNELLQKVSTISSEALELPESLFEAGKKMSGYGTWKMKLWCNKSMFGSELAEELEKHYIITHDEEKEPTPKDFEDLIDDVFWQFAFFAFNN